MRYLLFFLSLLFTGSYVQAGTPNLPLGGGGTASPLPVHKTMWSSKIRAKLFNDLAVVSARLKLYPLAMKCYFKANFPDSTPLGIGEVNFLQDTLWNEPAFTSQSPIESIPVKNSEIRASFDDKKTASAYAILVQVKQPAPGKRKSFTGINNVGHMFITLIKYNTDSSIVYRSFGFYPNKSTILSATPFHPSSPSVFKDDARHEWDELAGKFISPRRFKKIIELLQSYEGRVYHLNHNNCTDFGLTIARLGGIEIDDTRGRWPLGHGNNPANAGQSLLERKVCNIDEECPAPLLLTSKK